MDKLIGAVKLILLVLLVIVGLVVGMLYSVLPKKRLRKFVTHLHRCVIQIIGVKCQISGAEFVPGALLVSNHISWLDISVIGAQYSVVFLSKIEVAGWSVVGTLASKIGTLFIKRGEGATEAIREIAKTLNDQQTVALFPEGKTTDGMNVIRFQPRLFQAAIDSNKPVQPIAIRYTNNKGKRTRHVSYHGDVDFFESLWRVVCDGRVGAEVHLFEAIIGVNDRDSLSQQSQMAIEEWIIP